MGARAQIWFQTNLGFQSTKAAILKSGIITGDCQDWKGRLTFYLRKFKDVAVQITTKGKLGITYPEGMDYNIVLKELESLLVKADHTPAEITKTIREPSKPNARATEQYEKRLDAIRHENLSDPIIAYADLLFFVSTLPSPVRAKVESEIQQAAFVMAMLNRNPSWQQAQMQERKKRVMSFVVLYLINTIYTLLHGQIELTASQRVKTEFDSSLISWLEENEEDAIESLIKALKKAFPSLR